MIRGKERELYDLCVRYKRLACCDTTEENSDEMVTATKNIQRWLNHHENDALSLKAAPCYVGNGGGTGLHVIIEVPELPIEVVETWLKLSPETARVKDDIGMLPLHFACYEAPLKTVMALVEAYPKSVEKTMDYGDLPLHFACGQSYPTLPLSLDVLSFLLEAYPQSIDVEDNKDKASYLLKRWSQRICGYDSDSDEEKDSVDSDVEDFCNKTQERIRSLMFEAVIGGLSLVVKLLVHAFPESCKMLDRYGRAPLHYACSNFESVDIVMALLDAAPEIVTTKDQWERTPLELFMPVAKRRDENGMLLLHFQAAHSTFLTVSFLNFLIAAYPRSIDERDNRGMLPFQYAFLNKSLSVDVFMYFVELSPEIVDQKCPRKCMKRGEESTTRRIKNTATLSGPATAVG
eukprot:CAMPEP_0172419350 /NCGR_PEP_ID=MMETSP1064-20121228/5771_1 /TAXON_ID=202472 /ORGANISM="Aulacoseira subarctica , Strain CCAP 1002/5" /LENGTH=403 /DNA_ID=CAMNT_0013158777 /DNA_START=154 /DNA_END=1365 /DNA_ORIENTATION=+